MSEFRQMVVHTAQPWFVEAHVAAQNGDHKHAWLFLMNALNHTENALTALLLASTVKDHPPHSGSEPMSLEAMRAKLAALHA